MTHELTEEAFRSTFDDNMLDVTGSVESVVDIWEYVGELYVDEVVSEYVVANELVEKVYRNSASTFDHVLLPTEDPDVFLIIVVDLKNEKIFGHYGVDMKREYGVNS